MYEPRLVGFNANEEASVLGSSPDHFPALVESRQGMMGLPWSSKGNCKPMGPLKFIEPLAPYFSKGSDIRHAPCLY